MSHPPDSVVAARLLLVLLFAVAAYGSLDYSRRFLIGANPARDFLTLNWNLALAAATGFAFWAIGKRRPAGKWVAIAAFGAVILATLPVFLLALRGAQGNGLLAGTVIIDVVVGLEVYLLARGKNANRYFASSNEPKHDGDGVGGG
jgi:hypothetical protein